MQKNPKKQRERERQKGLAVQSKQRAREMSDSREASPDWLREFQAPARDCVALSSDSDSLPETSPKRSDPIDHDEPEKPQKRDDSIYIDSGEDRPVNKYKKPNPRKAKKRDVKEDTLAEVEAIEEDLREKPATSQVSSRLPLVFPDKVQRSKALVECDGDSIDLSGDVGAVGRIVVSKSPSGNHEMLLDLKGTIYRSTIVPSRTFCIVSVGQSEAKIEAIMNDFIQLEPQSNVFEAETMIEGTLDGFSFDSEEEGDKMPKPSAHQGNQIDENGDQAIKKIKGKAAKSLGVVHKKAKIAGKPPKRGTRKSQAVKRTRKTKK